MRLGVADHLGWAVAVAASADYEVTDRRRIELVEPDMTAAPIHYDRHRFDVAGMAELVTKVRASVVRATSAALDDIAAALPEPVESILLRIWPPDFPDDIAVQLRAPYEARADAVMYRQILADLAHARGWRVHLYDAKRVEAQAAEILGDRAVEVLQGPRARLGPRGRRTIGSPSPRPSSASWAPGRPGACEARREPPWAAGLFDRR